MMGYPFNDSGLRVKKDVSGLEVDALFWGVFPGKSIFSQVVELIHRQQFRRCVGALSWQLQGQIVFVLGSVLCMAFASQL